jgi:hypothetical protein
MESIVDEINQDLLDVGWGPDHIGLDGLERKWRVGSHQQQTKESTLTKWNLCSMASGAGDDETFTGGLDNSDMIRSDLDRWHAHFELLDRLDLAVGTSDSCDASMSAQVR